LVCKTDRACEFHAAGRDGAKLAAALTRALKRDDGAGLARWFLAGVCSSTTFPGEAIARIAALDEKALVVRVEATSSGELDSTKLRELAAAALALAVVLDAQDAMEGDEDG
jgi:hypothetical protein